MVKFWLVFIGLLAGFIYLPAWAAKDFALDCKRNYPRGMDYYMFFYVDGKAAVASKSQYPILDSKEGVLNWEDLRIQQSRDKKSAWYQTVAQYPTKSNYGDKREWFVEQEPLKPPKIYLRLSLPNAKDYDDRVVIYDIHCEVMERPRSVFQKAKQVYQRDLELRKYKYDIYPNFGFQKGFYGGFHSGRAN